MGGNETKIISTLQHAQISSPLTTTAYQSIYNNLMGRKKILLSLKWMLSSNSQECYDVVFKDLSQFDISDDEPLLTVDEELLILIFKTKTIHRFVETKFYPIIIHELISNKNHCKKFSKTCISQLRHHGFNAEAGFIV